MTKMWSGGLEYNLTGQGFDPTKGAVFRAGAVAAPGSNSNRELGVRSTLLAALLCCDTQLFLEEAWKLPAQGPQDSVEAAVFCSRFL